MASTINYQGKYITVSQYKDVTEERAVAKLCGYALCNNRITQVFPSGYYYLLKIILVPVLFRVPNRLVVVER